MIGPFKGTTTKLTIGRSPITATILWKNSSRDSIPSNASALAAPSISTLMYRTIRRSTCTRCIADSPIPSCETGCHSASTDWMRTRSLRPARTTPKSRSNATRRAAVFRVKSQRICPFHSVPKRSWNPGWWKQIWATPSRESKHPTNSVVLGWPSLRAVTGQLPTVSLCLPSIAATHRFRWSDRISFRRSTTLPCTNWMNWSILTKK